MMPVQRNLSASYRFVDAFEKCVDSTGLVFKASNWDVIKLLRLLSDVKIYDKKVDLILTRIFKKELKFGDLKIANIKRELSDFSIISPAFKRAIDGYVVTNVELKQVVKDLLSIAVTESIAIGAIVTASEFKIVDEGDPDDVTDPVTPPVTPPTAELTHYSGNPLYYADIKVGQGGFAMLNGYSPSGVDTLSYGTWVADSIDLPAIAASSVAFANPNFTVTTTDFALPYIAERLSESLAPGPENVVTKSGVSHKFVMRSIGDARVMLLEFNGNAQASFLSVKMIPLIIGKKAADVTVTPSISKITFRWLADNLLEIRVPTTFSSKVVHGLACVVPDVFTKVGTNPRAVSPAGGRLLSVTGIDGSNVSVTATALTRAPFAKERIAKAWMGVSYVGVIPGPYYADFSPKAALPMVSSNGNLTYTSYRADFDFAFKSTVHPDMKPTGVTYGIDKLPLEVMFSSSVTLVSAQLAKSALPAFTEVL